MKNIILTVSVIIAFFTSNHIYSQAVVISEDFETAPYVFTASGTSVTAGWTLNSRLQANGNFCDSCVITLNDSSYLTSGAFSTIGGQHAVLQFNHICKTTDVDYALIQYSLDNGLTWSNLNSASYFGNGVNVNHGFTASSYPSAWQSNNSTILPNNTWWQTEYFDISELSGNANVRIRFALIDGGFDGASQAAGWYVDDIKVTIANSEIIPPQVTQKTPFWQSSIFSTGPYTINAEVFDESGIASVLLIYSINGGMNDTLIMMPSGNGINYSASIPAHPYGDSISYYIVVTDNSLNHNIASTLVKEFTINHPGEGVTVGTAGYLDVTFPACFNGAYGWSSMIYRSNEINYIGWIDTLSFYIRDTVNNYLMTNQKIFLSEIADSIYSSGSIPDSLSATPVFAGDIIWHGQGWFSIALDTPFYYTGNQNLQLYWHNIDGSTAAGSPHVNSTQLPYMCSKYKNFLNFFSVFPNTAGALSNMRPNAKFHFKETTNNYDAGLYKIGSPLTGPVPSVGNAHNITVFIRNFGLNHLTSATINWELDGVVQTPFNWTGSLFQDQNSSVISLGNVTFTTTGNHTMKVYISSPNGNPDEVPINDTLTATFNVCTSTLAGTYTIDPLTPMSGNNFQFFSEVNNTLQNCGIRDSVVFQIVSGVYDTLLNFSYPIRGISDSTAIVFCSMTGNPADVVIQNNATTAAKNFVLNFSGSKNIRFENISLKALNTTYSRCIAIRKACSNLTFNGNIITGAIVSATDTNRAVIFNSPLSTDNNIRITNNTISNGSVGIYMNSPNSTLSEKNNIISGNSILNYYNQGVFAGYQQNLFVSGNYLKTTSAYTSGAAVYSSYSNFSTVSGNTVIQSTNYGLYYSQCNATTRRKSLLANNFVTIGGSGTSVGVFISQCNHLNIFHNSINCIGSSLTSSSALQYQISYGSILRNNIFANTNGGYALNISGINMDSDYNILFTTGQNLGDGYLNLTSWRFSSGMDFNSLSINPNFTASNNLHLFRSSVNNLGTPGFQINDIDGELRDLNQPDIGADEFDPIGEDAGIFAIYSPDTLTTLISGQPYNVAVKIINKGANPLTKVTIEWHVNESSQGSFTWVGLLQSDSVSVPFTIGTITTTSIGDYRIKIWTTMPNDSIDQFNINDTLSNTYHSCISQLSGIYSINPLTPTGSGNFQYFSEALSDLQYCGISDTTIFRIAPGTYDTSIVITRQINGANANAWVIFESATGNPADVILQDSATTATGNSIVFLSNCNYLKFRNLTFNAKNASLGTCISILNKASNINIVNNIIKCPPTTLTTTNAALIYSAPSSLENDIFISGNTLLNGSYAIYCKGTSPAVTEHSLTIENNHINNFYLYGIYAENQTGNTVRNNHVSSGSSYSWVTGIFFLNCVSFELSGNTIMNPENAGVFISDCEGIHLNNARIFNNFISVGGGLNSNALYLSGSNFIDIVNNSLHNYGQCGGSFTGTLVLDYTLNCKVFNNVIRNDCGGVVYEGDFSGNYIDYNNYFTTGPDLFETSMGYIYTLLEVQTIFQSDSFSLNLNPQYVNDTDLHVSSTLMNNKGKPSYVLFDIDGELRSSTTPDIGADEFNPPLFEASLEKIVSLNTHCGSVSDSLKIKISNNGASSINGNLIATYIVNESAPVSEIVTDTILPGNILQYTFATPVVMNPHSEQDSIYNFLVYIHLPGDSIQDNDSIRNFVVAYYQPPNPVVSNATIMCGDSITLHATCSDSVHWFSDAFQQYLVSDSMDYSTPPLYNTTVYYAHSFSQGVSLKFTELILEKNSPGATSPYPPYITTDDGDFLEITNVGLGGEDLYNYKLQLSAQTTQYSFPHVYLNPGEVVVVHIGAGKNNIVQNYLNTGGNQNSMYPCNAYGFVLRDPSGAVEDVLAVNAYTFPVSSGITSSDWSGNLVAAFGSAGVSRINSDNNISTDWIAASSSNLQSLGSPNAVFPSEVKAKCYSQPSEDTVFVIIIPDAGITQIVTSSVTKQLNDTNYVTATITNFGNNPLSSIRVIYKINGFLITEESWTGNLLPGDSVQYTFSTPAVFTGNQNELCAKTLLSNDVNAQNDSICSSIYISNIDEVYSGQTEIVASPNPASEYIELQISASESGESVVFIYNQMGVCVYTKNILLQNGITTIIIPTTEFEEGVYSYSTLLSGKNIRGKFVVVH